MARLIFSINNNTAEPFNNKWPGGNPDYVETSTITKTVTLGDGTQTTIEVDHANPDFFTGNPINSSCRHMGDIDNKSYFAVRDSNFVTWTYWYFTGGYKRNCILFAGCVFAHCSFGRFVSIHLWW